MRRLSPPRRSGRRPVRPAPHGSGRLRPGRLDGDAGAGAGREHHQSHDRGSADGFAGPAHLHIGVEALGGLDELGRGARMQAFFVDDFDDFDDRPVRRPCRHAPQGAQGRRIPSFSGQDPAGDGHIFAAGRLSCRDRLGERIFLAHLGQLDQHRHVDPGQHLDIGPAPCRKSPDSRACLRTCRSGSRRHRRYRRASPPPGYRSRRCSTSSSGPMVTASICFCGPTTCSSAERNSEASRPWVTRTRPIIEDTRRARERRTKGRQS